MHDVVLIHGVVLMGHPESYLNYMRRQYLTSHHFPEIVCPSRFASLSHPGTVNCKVYIFPVATSYLASNPSQMLQRVVQVVGRTGVRTNNTTNLCNDQFPRSGFYNSWKHMHVCTQSNPNTYIQTYAHIHAHIHTHTKYVCELFTNIYWDRS